MEWACGAGDEIRAVVLYGRGGWELASEERAAALSFILSSQIADSLLAACILPANYLAA